MAAPGRGQRDPGGVAKVGHWGVRGWKIVGERGTLLLMFTGDQLQGLGETELRALAQGLLKEINDRDAVIAVKNAEIAQRLAQIAHTDSEMLVKDRKLVWSEARIDQLTQEIAVLKRWKFSARSEQLDATQKSLLDELSPPDESSAFPPVEYSPV